MEGEKNIIYIYIKRPLALIKAQEKYRRNNKDKYNELSMKCYRKKMENPEYASKRKEYLKQKYIEYKERNLK